MQRPRPAARSGTILILVAGVSALLAGLCVVFLARMRSDVEETQNTLREAQAHIMLVAACNYIQEAARIGWEDPGSTDPYRKEAFGWIDVRDGAIGPKATRARSDIDPATLAGSSSSDVFKWGVKDDSGFPVMSFRRIPMFVKTIPPFAIRLDAAPNAIIPGNALPSNPPVARNGTPYLVRPDPMPVLAPVDPSNPSAAEFTAFETGNPRPRANSTGMAWFRLFRLGAMSPGDPRYDARFARYNAATFIVTCGAGGTEGYKDWAEVVGEGRQALFNNDQQMFEAMRSVETRLWYLVEWSPAVGGQYLFNIIHHRGWILDANGYKHSPSEYDQFPINNSHYSHSQARIKNYGGTIRMTQRLINEPPLW
jgi:hypothetical protein